MFRFPIKQSLVLLIAGLIAGWNAHSVQAQIKWGSPNSGSWSYGSNWTGGVRPGAGDTVTIDAQDVNQPDYWVTLDINTTVDSLTLSTMTGGLTMSGRIFETTNGASLWSGKTSLFGSTWNSGGMISNGGEFLVYGDAGNNYSTINGDFANSGTLDIVSSSGLSRLLVNGESGNSGLVNLRSNNGRTTTFEINNNTAYNNSGVIRAFAPTTGAAAASFFRTNDLNNTGTIRNDSGAAMVFDRSGATYQNSNQILGGSGGIYFDNLGQFHNTSSGVIQSVYARFDGNGAGVSSLINDGTIVSTGNPIRFQQLTLTNNGTISGTGASGFELSGVIYNHAGGLTGFGSIDITGSTVTLNSDLSVAGNSSLAGSTFHGSGALRTTAGSTIDIRGLNSNALFENSGNATSVNIGGSFNQQFSQGLANASTGTLVFEAIANSSSGFLEIDVAGDMDNHGVLSLNSSSQYTNRSGIINLEHSGGTLTNHAGGVIQSNMGSSNYFTYNRLRTDHLVNHGTLANNSPGWFYLDRAGAVYENHGLIDAANSHFYFQNLGSFTNHAGGTVEGYHFNFYGEDRATSTFANAGTIHPTSGGLSLVGFNTIDNTGSIQVTGSNFGVSQFNTFNNSGAIQLGSNRTLSFSGGTYNHQAGASITGGDTLSFASTAINLGTDFTTDFATVNVSNGTINGPGMIHNASGTELNLTNTTVNTAFHNSGNLNVNGIGITNSSYLDNGLVNTASGVVKVHTQYTNTSAQARLFVTGDIDNSGRINVTSATPFTNRSVITYLEHTGGTLTNQSGGLIESTMAPSNYFYRNYLRTDHLVNHGTLANNSPGWFHLDRTGAVYENHGLIDAANSHFYFQNLGSFTNHAGGTVEGYHFNFYGEDRATSTFANAGTIHPTSDSPPLVGFNTIDNTGSIQVTGSNFGVSQFNTFNNSGAIQLGSNRTLSFSGGTYNHQAGASITGGDTLTFSSTAINLGSDFTTDFTNANITNGIVSGPGVVNNANGTQLSIVDTTFNTAVNNAGDLRVNAIGISNTSHLNNGLVNSASGTVTIHGQYTNAGGQGRLSVTGDIENSGHINLTSATPYTNRGSNAYLEHSGGTFTNHAGGLIESTMAPSNFFWQNYLRTDHLVNHGTIANNSPGWFYLDRADATYENHGLITAATSHIYFQNMDSFTNESDGVLAAVGGNLYFNGTEFRNEGTITGSRTVVFSGGAMLNNEGLISPGQSPGTLNVSGNMTLGSNSTLLIELGGTDQGTNYDLLAVSGLANLGGFLQIELFDGFLPTSNDSFTFLTGSSINGEFANATETISFADGQFDVVYGSGSVMLTNFSAVPEPGGFCLLSISCLAIFGRRKRRIGSTIAGSLGHRPETLAC